jgi:ATP-dependent DNA helicase RecQ
VERVTVQEVLDMLHEAANDARRGGRSDALRLITAHGAKGLEFDHVIVMDCRDWRWNSEDDRRLLYVAMTRARLTLVVMRTDDGANACLADLSSVEGVAERLPAARPDHRIELDRRYVTLGPADVDLGYVGRLAASDPIHATIAGLRAGDSVRIDDRQLHDFSGKVVGRLAKKCELPDRPLCGKVVAIMVRTRAQTPDEFQVSVKVDRWEVPLVEVIVC